MDRSTVAFAVEGNAKSKIFNIMFALGEPPAFCKACLNPHPAPSEAECTVIDVRSNCPALWSPHSRLVASCKGLAAHIARNAWVC